MREKQLNPCLLHCVGSVEPLFLQVYILRTETDKLYLKQWTKKVKDTVICASVNSL